jgi:metal-responsive CopG/Arc/MetJ family transcriptional regulator
MPAKIPKVSIYIPEDLKKDLERLAIKETRSLSNLINVILQRAVDDAKKTGDLEIDRT